MRVSFFRLPVVFLLGPVLVALLGCGFRSSQRDFVPQVARVFMEETSLMPTSHLVEAVLPLSGTRIPIRSRPILVETDILQAGKMESELGPALVLVLTPQATRDLTRASASNLGRRLVLTLNGVPVGARSIDRILDGGMLAFYIEIDDDDMDDLVEAIGKTSQRIQSQKR